MIGDFYSKMKCKLLAALKDIKPKVISKTTSDDKDTVVESTVEDDNESSNNDDTVKEPINVVIRRPVCEYSHGKKFKSAPKWIVVHYTGCANVGARSMCKAMKNNTGASSHFYIDENDICAAVPLEYIAWHCGDGQCKQPEAYNKLTLIELTNYKAKDWRYDLAAKNHLKWQAEGDDFIGNKCSISVDICVKKRSVSSKKATDKDWYFEDRAVDNLAKTVAYLAKKYNIDCDRIIRHADCVGKLCPRPFVSITSSECNDEEWYKFLNRVTNYIKDDINVEWV